MKEGINNKMKGKTNACPKQGDTPVKQGDTQGVGSRLHIAYYDIDRREQSLLC